MRIVGIQQKPVKMFLSFVSWRIKIIELHFLTLGFILTWKIIAGEITPTAPMLDEIIPTVSIHYPSLAGENCVWPTSCQTTQSARLPKDSHQSDCNRTSTGAGSTLQACNLWHRNFDNCIKCCFSYVQLRWDCSHCNWCWFSSREWPFRT